MTRSAEVPAERPERVLEILLAAWLGQPEIRSALRVAVDRYVTGAADPMELAAAAGDGQRQKITTGVIQLVGSQVPAGRVAADRAVRWAVAVARSETASVARLQEAAEILRSDLAGELAFRHAVGLARETTFYWPDDGPTGNPGSLTSAASRRSWSVAVMALGRRFAGCCLECGQPVARTKSAPWVTRAGDVRERPVRRDYCGECEDGDLSATVSREKALKRWIPTLAEAIDRRRALAVLRDES